MAVPAKRINLTTTSLYHCLQTKNGTEFKKQLDENLRSNSRQIGYWNQTWNDDP